MALAHAGWGLDGEDARRAGIGVGLPEGVAEGAEQALLLSPRRGAPREVRQRVVDALALRRPQTAVTPPSTGSAAPVTNDASSESRNRAAFAISSGFPVRPSGTEPAARLATSSSGSMPAVDF